MSPQTGTRDVTCSRSNPLYGEMQPAEDGNLFISYLICWMTLRGLASCYISLISFNSRPMVYKIHKKFKNMQHKRNHTHTNTHTRRHKHTHRHLRPPISLSIRLALTLTGFREIAGLSCGRWGRVVIEKQWQWFQQQNPCSLSGFITVLRKYRCRQKAYTLTNDTKWLRAV